VGSSASKLKLENKNVVRSGGTYDFSLVLNDEVESSDVLLFGSVSTIRGLRMVLSICLVSILVILRLGERLL
jgi:hypothetical protein